MVYSLEDSGLSTKDVNKTIKNEAKRTKGQISWHVIKHIRCQFIRKYVTRKRHIKSWQWSN